MKFFRYVAYLFYSYYSSGSTKNTAYLRSILSLSFLTFITVLEIFLLLDINKFLFLNIDDTREERYLKIFFIASPIWITYFATIREKDIIAGKERKSDYNGQFRDKILLWSYLIISFVLLVITTVIKKGHQ
jgi:hypothetical protein